MYVRKDDIVLLFFMLFMACGSLCALAQDEVDEEPIRPVASIFNFDFGHASLLDTYLSPIRYGGKMFRLSYEAQRAAGFSPEKWNHQLDFGVDYDITHNPAENHTTHSLMADVRWGMMYRWRDVFTDGLHLKAGGSTQLRGGVLYNDNNSNNVVSVRAHWSLGFMGQALYNLPTRLPITLRYQATLPLAGVFFCPEYDEAYYEIYLGNRRNLAHFGWLGNRFDMENLVTVDFHFGSTILRVGYRNRVESSWINNINTQAISHGIVVGIGGELTGVNSKKRSNPNKKICSVYQ